MASKKMNVFLVDDSSMYLKSLEKGLKEKDKWKLHKFISGEAALESDKKPDILVVDYYMNAEKKEAMNGVEIIGEFRKKYPSLPAVILSGKADLSSSSNSKELMDLLAFDPKGVKEEFRKGSYFYMMKDKETIANLESLIWQLTSKGIV